MENSNSAQFERTLQAVIADDRRHARLLGLLAHLEYVGARKIAKALPASHADADHLEHLMEEARHALLLRRQAEKLWGTLGKDGAEEVDLLKKRAEAYLQGVDHGIDQTLQNACGKYRPFTTYLVVSLIIEERAMKFYPFYHRLLPEGEIKETIQAILKDEIGHLEEMRRQCKDLLEDSKELMHACRQVELSNYSHQLAVLLESLVQ